MKKLYIITLAAAALLSIGASAQSFRSGYFLDNYVYGYRINPAQVNDRGFMGLAISNIDLQNVSNIGVSSLLFPNGNSLVTGLNKAVSADTFLGGLKPDNFISLDESINVLSFGIANGKRMHTVELNARVMSSQNLPYELFSLAKKGSTGSYDLGGLFASENVLADLSYGYSQWINDNLSVGGRVHLLLGIANVNLSANNTAIYLGPDKISISPDLSVAMSGMLGADTKADGSIDLNSLGLKGSPVGGFGATLDLGVQYKSDFGLEAMFSITDLGMISWKNSISGTASGAYEYSGGSISFDGGTVKTDITDALNGITDAISFKTGAGKSSMSMMPFNIAAGARYFMPFYNKLSVGALATYHNAKYASWFDARLGATFTPARIITLTGNIGYGTFGAVWGAAVDLHLGPVNLLVGMDSFLGKTGTIKGVPVAIPIERFMQNVHVGLAFTF